MDYIRETVEYLKNYNNLDIARQNLKDEILELEEALKSVGQINYSDMPLGSQTKLPDDKTINKMFRLSKAKEEYKTTLITIKRMDKVLKIFNETNPKFYTILKAYFIDHLVEEDILKQFSYSERHLRRLKEKALRSFAVQLFGVKTLGV